MHCYSVRSISLSLIFQSVSAAVVAPAASTCVSNACVNLVKASSAQGCASFLQKTATVPRVTTTTTETALVTNTAFVTTVDRQILTPVTTSVVIPETTTVYTLSNACETTLHSAFTSTSTSIYTPPAVTSSTTLTAWRTVTLAPQVAHRSVPTSSSGVPLYASSACPYSKGFSSACVCAGVTPKTTTLRASTVTATTTLTQTVPITETQTQETTEQPTSTVTFTSSTTATFTEFYNCTAMVYTTTQVVPTTSTATPITVTTTLETTATRTMCSGPGPTVSLGFQDLPWPISATTYMYVNQPYPDEALYLGNWSTGDALVLSNWNQGNVRYNGDNGTWLMVADTQLDYQAFEFLPYIRFIQPSFGLPTVPLSCSIPTWQYKAQDHLHFTCTDAAGGTTFIGSDFTGNGGGYDNWWLLTFANASQATRYGNVLSMIAVPLCELSCPGPVNPITKQCLAPG